MIQKNNCKESLCGYFYMFVFKSSLLGYCFELLNRKIFAIIPKICYYKRLPRGDSFRFWHTMVGANRQLQSVYRVLDPDILSKELLFKGVRWEFAPGCAPWRQACAESLIASVKKCLFFAIGSQVLSLIEFQTVLFETANLLNDRPIGRHPTQLEGGFYLSPNSLLLGRTMNQSVPFIHVKTEKMARHLAS